MKYYDSETTPLRGEGDAYDLPGAITITRMQITHSQADDHLVEIGRLVPEEVAANLETEGN